jgi:6-methylsalicylate decarboxylase
MLEAAIDVHHHVLPPMWLAEAREHKAGGWAKHVLEWTPERSLEQMERYGIGTAIVTLGLPGVWWGDVASARRLARSCNEYAAAMRRDHPGRFGFFATLPMPDVDGSLTEIAYGLDVLKADGIGLLTSYADVWPGDPRLDAVFAELNRRGAAVYFHPTVPECCRGILPDVPVATLEYTFDTTRAVTNLLFTGTLTKYPDSHYIFSHAGGTIPMLADRIAHIGNGQTTIASRLPNGIAYEFSRLNFEIATSVSAPTFAALRNFTSVDRMLLGTDYPYVDVGETIPTFDALDLSGPEKRAITRANALKLFPAIQKQPA